MKESENIMSIVRLENIKIREDILQSQVLLKACGIFGIPQKYVVDYKIIEKSIDAYTASGEYRGKSHYPQ